MNAAFDLNFDLSGIKDSWARAQARAFYSDQNIKSLDVFFIMSDTGAQ
jgi:hypothetical protein